MKLIISIIVACAMMIWAALHEWWALVAIWAVLIILLNYHNIRRIFAEKNKND